MFGTSKKFSSTLRRIFGEFGGAWLANSQCCKSGYALPLTTKSIFVSPLPQRAQLVASWRHGDVNKLDCTYR
ncbi:hypothetical protein TIFTF001_007005 [Ficus carica]|uniref:Uncharacterized protein n=1 Tax=Ficus carica TaxID=3494 RepID=A0AA87ZQK2_FICCA|nr:hypothetical protein TIFTF001_007005 [Ficus carica]